MIENYILGVACFIFLSPHIILLILIFRIASGPKPKEETKERKSSIDGKERKSSIVDGREKKEGKEKLTKAAAAANSVRAVSIKHNLIISF